MLQEKAREPHEKGMDSPQRRISFADLSGFGVQEAGDVDVAVPPSPETEAEMPFDAIPDAAEAAAFCTRPVTANALICEVTSRRSTADGGFQIADFDLSVRNPAEFRSSSKQGGAMESRKSSKVSVLSVSSNPIWEQPPGRRSTADSLVSWSSPCWEEALSMLRQDSGDEAKSAKEQTLPKKKGGAVGHIHPSPVVQPHGCGS